MKQEFKVGQKVRVIEGYNIEHTPKEGTDENVGNVVSVDTEYKHQPCIAVQFDSFLHIWIYPEGERKFNVEILEEPQTS